MCQIVTVLKMGCYLNFERIQKQKFLQYIIKTTVFYKIHILMHIKRTKKQIKNVIVIRPSAGLDVSLSEVC